MMDAVAIPPFERFYREHCDEVLAYLRRLLGQRAEDAWQETFLRALRAYGRLQHGKHLRAWVFTIATNVAMDELRPRRQLRLVCGALRDGSHPFRPLVRHPGRVPGVLDRGRTARPAGSHPHGRNVGRWPRLWQACGTEPALRQPSVTTAPRTPAA